MQIITFNSHIGSDGILQLKLPNELKNQNLMVIIRPQTTEWLSILQKTAGSIPDLERLPQDKYEVRESL
ncbi:MAG: hypothetical protein F6K14_23170 [Symploca sp. SIO2C1]|nr:hypothetical protein [Symploca sp. SIO2C1]